MCHEHLLRGRQASQRSEALCELIAEGVDLIAGLAKRDRRHLPCSRLYAHQKIPDVVRLIGDWREQNGLHLSWGIGDAELVCLDLNSRTACFKRMDHWPSSKADGHLPQQVAS